MLLKSGKMYRKCNDKAHFRKLRGLEGNAARKSYPSDIICTGDLNTDEENGNSQSKSDSGKDPPAFCNESVINIGNYQSGKITDSNSKDLCTKEIDLTAALLACDKNTAVYRSSKSKYPVQNVGASEKAGKIFSKAIYHYHIL